MKKILFLCSILLLVGGCSAVSFIGTYDLMRPNVDGIEGYSLTLSIHGSNDGNIVNDIVRVDSYLYDGFSTDYRIHAMNAKTTEGGLELHEEIMYVVAGDTYMTNDEGLFTKMEEDVNYNKPYLYIESLNKITKINKIKIEKVNDQSSKVYDVVFDRTIIREIIDDLGLGELELSNDVRGQLYLDSNGYVYRITYYLNDMTIDADYFNIDFPKTLELPSEIEIDR